MSGRRITWGRILAVSLVLLFVTASWRMLSLVMREKQTQGDGVTLESYGFVLDPLLVDRTLISPSGARRGDIEALDMPRSIAIEVAETKNEFFRGKFLVSSERVIGVSIGGKSRAYPLSVLNWHEVVNDTLAGVPFTLVYSPVADAAVAFDRRIRGEEVFFAYSGLLYNSTSLVFDRRESPDGPPPSLWSPLQRRAVAGPAAAEKARLTILPLQMVQWSTWKAAHPETDVIEPLRERDMLTKYKKKPYAMYRDNDDLHYPVDPLLLGGGLAKKTPTVAVLLGDSWWNWPLPEIADKSDENGVYEFRSEAGYLRFETQRDPLTVYVSTPESAAPAPPLMHAYLFAWYATQARLPATNDD